MLLDDYFLSIENDVQKSYELARAARAKGIDPVSLVEVPIAHTLAEKAVGLISTLYPQLQGSGVVERILELEKEHGPLDMAVSFQIAEEISRERFCRFASLLEAIDAGIRVGFSYITLGVVSSPLEGFTELKLGKTAGGEDYFVPYFSGPIRSAGTTASCMVLMLIDYLRERFGFARYDPTEEEVRRYVTENYDYHERVTNLQYLPLEEEIVFLARHLPIQISGEASAQREVSNYRDLKRVETNFIRGGMCLIFSEGLAQKAQKALRLWKGLQAKGFQMSGWEFLDEYVALYKQRKKGDSVEGVHYIKDLVAGRPVYGHPSRSGGFRFRYGRSRVGGFSATSVHPATMGISDSFLSFGTQLKIEKPTKGCVISACDSIDGPIVRLKNGSVVRVTTLSDAQKLYSDVSEILYLGDILISYGDVVNRNYPLLRPGYVEEWWVLELNEKVPGITVDPFSVGFEDAVRFSEQYGVPLHPHYIYYWSEIEREGFVALLQWLALGRVYEGKLVLPYFSSEREALREGKRSLELLGCEHSVHVEYVILSRDETRALLTNLGILVFDGGLTKIIEELLPRVGEGSVLECVNEFSRFVIKDKSGTFIGCRMGRPEKAKLRRLTGSPHMMFPVGEEGGRLRSLQAAMDVGFVHAEFPLFFCGACSRETIYPRCEGCQGLCERLHYSPREDRVYRVVPSDGVSFVGYKEQKIDIRQYFEHARKLLGFRNEEIPMIKGVRGTSNKDHSCEPLAKGILRARYGLPVNKDGTIRYDMTEMAITHFKPLEIGTSVAVLRKLGYDSDMYGNLLERDDQILVLFPHDVILPSCPISEAERADEVFLKISQFVDDELEKIYGLPRFFNARTHEDLIGSLVACIAPHICTTTVGRLIGFSETQTFLASPYMHAAMRRDCDGDECAVMLLMDMLVNFSRKFLPAHRGGTQDAPLVLNIRIRAGDVDDQILDFELSPYPLALYRFAEQGAHSSVVEIDSVRRRLRLGEDPFSHIFFTHSCQNIHTAVLNSSYKILPTMKEKVDRQMQLCGKIRAVDIRDVARLLIERHFIRDTRGNLRKFSMQVFRCVGCNEKFRRPPLSGACTRCGGRLIFTVSAGSILKYMQPALDIARKYNVSPYLIESLELNEMYIQSIFGKEKEKQEVLEKWF